MSAELCDCFTTKREGVVFVLDAVSRAAKGRPVSVWTVPDGLLPVEEARRKPLACAAANWHALASYVALQLVEGKSLLIDMGSTTTDLIPLEHGRPAAEEHGDTSRLRAGTLVYLGATRTPLMALGPQIVWRGSEYGVMNELFATTGDMHVLIRALPEDPDWADTPDGRPLTEQACATRVVRMIGGDLDTMCIEDAKGLAGVFSEMFEQRIKDALRRVIRGHEPTRVVLSGSGALQLQRAVEAALPGVPRVMLSDLIGELNSAAGCAYALTQLV